MIGNKNSDGNRSFEKNGNELGNKIGEYATLSRLTLEKKRPERFTYG